MLVFLGLPGAGSQALAAPKGTLTETMDLKMTKAAQEFVESILDDYSDALEDSFSEALKPLKSVTKDLTKQLGKAAAAPVAGASMFALRYLWPHVQARAPKLQIPVLVYVAVISTMVVCAAASIGKVWNPWILPGAVAFYASDLAVARHRFVTETFSNKLWGTPLYFGAQLLLAASVATTPP